jgi:signal transduction histidine kinase
MRWLSALIFSASVTAAFAAETPLTNSAANPIANATNHVGRWIWDAHVADKQTCRLWKSFEITGSSAVSHAFIRITVDNGYRLFLDGREIGRGSDWRTITEYDVTWLLNHGPHVIAVEGFNDRLEAGCIFGLEIQRLDQSVTNIVSDESWRVVPLTVRNWTAKKNADPNWPHAVVVGTIHSHPWENWPYAAVSEPPIQPLVTHFWQQGWFQLSLAIFCVAALLFCVWLFSQLNAQSRAQLLLQVERARIARDIHDDLGARLTELLLAGEVSQSQLPAESQTRSEIAGMCEKARGLAHALDEVVWAVNSRRDTLRDFVNYVCKHALYFFQASPIRCRLDVEPNIPADAFDLPVRRNLFLAVKEALNNAAKHSGASELYLRIHRANEKLVVVIEDNGRGFDTAALKAERNGLTNMVQRMSEIHGVCRIESLPDSGTRIEFTVPLAAASQPGWFKRLRRNSPDAELLAYRDDKTSEVSEPRQ